jgi:hypothetical protein
MRSAFRRTTIRFAEMWISDPWKKGDILGAVPGSCCVPEVHISEEAPSLTAAVCTGSLGPDWNVEGG